MRTLYISNCVDSMHLISLPFPISPSLPPSLPPSFPPSLSLRCACNGHSSRCGNSIDSVCECVHNTDGGTCGRCLPLYNDKLWRYGETSNAYPCKICDCSGHADSCHYDASLDPFPNSYDQGGGGVCENCQSNTGIYVYTLYSYCSHCDSVICECNYTLN